ncbi:MAG: flavodoxin family protein [Candidatus Marinimicrobia bacterium]|nr:flavodoxin family protein [Candidatus Neomarinimicrobiota bacterium]
MGNILILYDSATGNTRQMAEFVASGAKSQNHNIRLKSIQQANKDDIIWCNGVAVGSPTNMGIVSWKMKKFWDKLGDELWGKIDGKIGCAFSSSGGWGGGAEITCQSILTILINFGFLVFGVTDYVDKNLTLHYGSVVAGEPRSESEKESCRRLGEKLSLWVSNIITDSKDENM